MYHASACITYCKYIAALLTRCTVGMCVCVYVCMYVCMYVFMYVYMYVCMYVCMCVCMYVCMCTYSFFCLVCIPFSLTQNGSTLLQHAIITGQDDIAVHLLAVGADPDMKDRVSSELRQNKALFV